MFLCDVSFFRVFINDTSSCHQNIQHPSQVPPTEDASSPSWITWKGSPGDGWDRCWSLVIRWKNIRGPQSWTLGTWKCLLGRRINIRPLKSLKKKTPPFGGSKMLKLQGSNCAILMGRCFWFATVLSRLIRWDWKDQKMIHVFVKKTEWHVNGKASISCGKHVPLDINLHERIHNYNS